MIRAVQFCPDTALLVPGTSGRQRPLAPLWRAAVASLREQLAGIESLLLLAPQASGGPASWRLESIVPGEFAFGAVGVAAHWLDPEIRVLPQAEPAPTVLPTGHVPGPATRLAVSEAEPGTAPWPARNWPISLAVAAAIASTAGWRERCPALVVRGQLPPGEVARAAEFVRAQLAGGGPSCLLVVGSGSARDGEHAPLSPLAGAGEENDRLVEVLSDPNPANRAWLRDRAPQQAERLAMTGASVWQIVERLAGPVHAERVQWNRDLGVPYPVITWVADPPPASAEPPTAPPTPAAATAPGLPQPAPEPADDDAPIAIVGPTATGKSELALALAQRLGGQIINADAMQLYRGMDIGTAKIPLEERGGVVHHMLDVLDLAEEASVAAYQRQVRALITDLRARGIRPILAGGSGLYLRAALDDLQFPPTDPLLRERLLAQAQDVGAAAMHARLVERDPLAAERIPAANVRRTVRALEVIELTGQPFSATMPQHRYAIAAHQFGLHLPLAELDERIATRTDAMLQAGWLAEVAELADRGLATAPTASKAVGYRELLEVVMGRCDLAQARAGIVQATSRLARRQLKWFRRDPRIVWLPGTGADVEELADRIVAAVGQGAS